MSASCQVQIGCGDPWKTQNKSLKNKVSACRQSARVAALRLLAAVALRLRQERGAPALLPYLPAMMLPLVRQDERSHSRSNLDAALPTHLAEVRLRSTCVVTGSPVRTTSTCTGRLQHKEGSFVQP